MAEKDKNNPNKQVFLRVRDAAKFLQVKPKTMTNWRYRGTGPAWRKHGGSVVYSLAELERYSGDEDKTHVG